MVPVFSYSNQYATTWRIHSFARTNPHSATAAQLVVAVSRPLDERSPDVSFQHALKLYAAFQPAPDGSGWRSVQAVCEALPYVARSFDMRALVHVGLLNGILRCVCTLPVPVDSERIQPPAAGAELPSTLVSEGTHDPGIVAANRHRPPKASGRPNCDSLLEMSQRAAGAHATE